MYIERFFILMIIGGYIASPMLFIWCLNEGHTWYLPFIIWIGLIIFTFWTSRSQDIDQL